MVSRANLSGRPRPSGVLKTVQDGAQDDLAVAGGDVGGVTGPRRRRAARINATDYPYGEPPEIDPNRIPPTVGIDDPNPDFIEPPPVIQVPPTAPTPVRGGSRSGGGAGYRARTGNIARETTEAQEQAGRGGRFGEQQVSEYGRTRPLPSSAHPQGVARYSQGAGLVPRWETGVGGGGYGTDPGPLPPPPPPIVPDEPPPPPPRPPRDRDGRGGRRRGRGNPRTRHR